MNIKSFIILSLIITTGQFLYSQEELTIDDEIQLKQRGEGEVNIYQDPSLNQLLHRYYAINSEDQTIEGYRIQLYKGSSQNSRKEAEMVKAKVQSLFPDIKVYTSFLAPDWRVKVGDFRRRSDALKMYDKIKKYFEESYIVNDPETNFPEL